MILGRSVDDRLHENFIPAFLVANAEDTSYIAWKTNAVRGIPFRSFGILLISAW
jgi:hypothetical protein